MDVSNMMYTIHAYSEHLTHSNAMLVLLQESKIVNNVNIKHLPNTQHTTQTNSHYTHHTLHT